MLLVSIYVPGPWVCRTLASSLSQSRAGRQWPCQQLLLPAAAAVPQGLLHTYPWPKCEMSALNEESSLLA